MGQEISLPVLISPTGVQAVHPDGEVAVARAAAARGTAMGLSSFASKPIEEVIAANPKIFFQIYWLGGRDAIAARVERARAAGAVGLIVTTDWSFCHGRDWGSPKIPGADGPRDHGADAARGPDPAALVLAVGEDDAAAQPARAQPGRARRGRVRRSSQAYGEWMGTPPPTWEDIAWLRELWGGPFMLKGVMRVDDAKRAVDAVFRRSRCPITAATTWTARLRRSGRCPRSPRLSATRSKFCSTAASGAAATSSRPLALGARAVMIGRAYLWGLAANGQAGVENVLDILRGGIDSALLGLGQARRCTTWLPTTS